MLHSLLNDWSFFGVAAKFLWLAQLGLIVHVLKTGRPYYWVWLLFIAPAIGGIAYVLIELLPDLRAPGGGGGFSWKPRAWRIRELRAEIEETDTVKLRLALASELLAAGQAEEARTVAEEALHGVFRDDPHTLAAVARYRLEAGRVNEALAALDQITIKADRMLALSVSLLRGRALVLAGRHAEAQAALREIVGTYIGEEPRYFLALSLQQSGAVPEARALWEEIRKRYRRAGRGWRRAEKRWFKLSSERLRETGV
ncbi:MAG: hypothetical protein NTV51_08295 [Verrucomicrobia bacterium]|nr:hypothetical protein [Verrucomicrobiota bacterium]